MKFIHTGDIHYGMNPDSDKPWSRERADAVRDVLSTIVSAAKEKNTDLLLIAGDLYNRQPLVRDLKEVNYLFTTIPHTHVVIIAGNHDRINDSSAVLSFPWAENVTYLSSETLASVYFEDINTEVYGFSWHTHDIKENALSGIRIKDNGRINILTLHGGDQNYFPFDKNELANAGFSYCALGHIHKPEVVIPDKMAFCGSPEPLNLSETGKHGYFEGEINPVSRVVTSLSFVPCAKAEYISLVVNVTAASTNTELLLCIGDEINKRGSDNIYRLKIRGMRDPDTVFDLDVLSKRFRISEILDESEPKYDFAKLFSEHPSDMIGFFVQELDKPDISPVGKKALYYGVNALLRTTDERNSKL